MTKYNLVTTPIYKTWSKDSVNILAGEWCRVYEDFDLIKEYEYQVANYHWDDRNKYFNDSNYLRDINEKSIEILTQALNEYHETSYPKRFWQILIGPWLHKFINIIFDKNEILKCIINKYEIGKTQIINIEKSIAVPTDTREFNTLMWDDHWNHHIFSELLINFYKIKYDLIELGNDNFKLNKKFINQEVERSIKFSVLDKYDFYTKKFLVSNSHEYFIKNSSLSILNEIKLNLKLNKSPTLNFSTPKNNFKLENLNRKNFLNNHGKFEDKFLEMLLFMIRQQFPTIFLELFKELNKQLETLRWPVYPKKIFTSNAYEYDEYFKLYTAKKILSGAKLIIGQHGGFMGTSKWNHGEDHQIEISDIFLTWGWGSGNKKVKKGFNFTNLANKTFNYKKNKKAIFITHPIARYSWKTSSWPVGATQSKKYIDEHLNFFKNLDHRVQKNFVYRILQTSDNLCRTNYIKIMKDFNDEIEIDPGSIQLNKVLKLYKLACIPYNATNYLHTLSINFPTVIFWNESMFELRDEAVEHFETLKSSKIFHTNHLSASKHINSIWDDIDLWWKSSEVQRTRILFCNQFIKAKKHKQKELIKLLNTQ